MDFEDFMYEAFCDGYRGLKDYDEWRDNMGMDEIEVYIDLYGKAKNLEGFKEAVAHMEKAFSKAGGE